MKRALIVTMSLIFILGCGSNQEEAKKKEVSKSDKFIVSGMKFLKDGDIPRAVRSFDQAIKSDPSNVRNYIVLGQVYLQLKNYQGAVDVLTAATRVDPANGETYYLLATSRALRGDPEDREKAVEAAKMSIQVYLKNRDEDRFKRAVALLQSLNNQTGVTETTEAKVTEQMKETMNLGN